MASMDFTELFTLMGTPPPGSWSTADLAAYGVPANAVAVILMINTTESTAITIGAREVGSSLNRYVVLHEAEGGGATSVIMHVQTDSGSDYQKYTSSSYGTFYLLGYYGSGITYTEEMTLHEPTVAGWRSTAVGQNNTVFEFLCQNIDNGNTAQNVGTRKVGSSLARYQDIHEAEPSGINTYTSYVQSDGSGNVELHRADAYGQFYRLGYFSTNVQLEERFDLCTPASDGTWSEQTIVAGGETCVGLIACMHQSNNTEELTGARGGASAVARYWSEHESETDQYTGDTLPILIDASGKYDTYFGDVSDGYFHCLGYLFVSGVAGLSINVHETINTVESLAEGLPLPGISKFESLTLAEFRQMLISLNPSVFKSLTVAEYINLFMSGGNTNVFNNITIQEVIAAAIKLTDINKYDQVTINEAITILIGVLGLIIESDDTINITEYVKANISIFSNVSDVVNIIESIIIAMKLAGVNKYDQITIQEAITAAINLVGVNKYDQITIQELIISVIKLVGIDKYDQVTIQEAITAAIKLVDIDKYDQVVINETIIMALGILASVSDTINVQEVIAATIELLASVSDKIDITEYAKANIPIPANAFDDITIQELITSAMKLADIGKYEQITIVEATTVAVGILNLMIESEDVINITEVVMMAVKVLASTSDTINIVEYIEANISMSANISDVVRLTEAIIMALPISISVSDTPVIIENIVTAMSLAGVSISESVTLAEYQNLLFDLFSSSHEKLTITEYIMASILAPTAYPLLMTLAKSVEYGIDLSKSVEYGVSLSKSVEYGVSLSKVGGGVAT